MADDDALSIPTPPESAPAPEAAPAETTPEVAPSDPMPTPAVSEREQAPEVAEPEAPPFTSTPASQPTASPAVKEPRHWTDADRAKAAAVHHQQTEAELAKIVEFVGKHERVTNDEVEKLLHVSDATAGRYLKLLVDRGVLKKEGSGRGVSYVLANV